MVQTTYFKTYYALNFMTNWGDGLMRSSTLCIYGDGRKWVDYPQEFNDFIEEANQDLVEKFNLKREQLWNKSIIRAKEAEYGIFEFFS